MSDVIIDYILFDTLSSFSAFLIVFDIGVHFGLSTDEFSYWDSTSFILEFSNYFRIGVTIVW